MNTINNAIANSHLAGEIDMHRGHALRRALVQIMDEGRETASHTSAIHAVRTAAQISGVVRP